MERIRKAITAGLTAALAVVIAAIQKDGAPHTGEGWAGLVAGALAAGVIAGAAVYAVPNKNTVNGSDPGQV